MKTHFCLFQVSLEVEILSSSSCTGSLSSNEVAPATTDEIRVASYLIISAAFNDYDPKLNITLPRQLNYFVDEVKDGVVTDACLKSAKDTTGQCPYYINPVHAVMLSKYNLSLDSNSTSRWHTTLTAGKRDRTRLCASSNGKSKSTRLKDMLPTVARFILAQGPAEMWAELVAVCKADKQSSGQSSKKAIMHHLMRCLRTVLFGTVRYFNTVP